MPQYLSHGVYVEEVPSSAAPIAGVSTSIAAFIGQAADNVTMPFRPGRPLDPDNIVPADRYTVAAAGAPQLITSWEQFKNTFGDFQGGYSDPAPRGLRVLQQRRLPVLGHSSGRRHRR